MVLKVGDIVFWQLSGRYISVPPILLTLLKVWVGPYLSGKMNVKHTRENIPIVYVYAWMQSLCINVHNITFLDFIFISSSWTILCVFNFIQSNTFIVIFLLLDLFHYLTNLRDKLASGNLTTKMMFKFYTYTSLIYKCVNFTHVCA